MKPAAFGDATERREMAETFGKYKLLQKIAQGGMAEIFLATREGDLGGFEKRVAIKRIFQHLTGREETVKMFFDEARIAATLSHPNIVQIFDLGEVEGYFYIAMEFVQGTDVRRVCKRGLDNNNYIPIDLAARIVADTAGGLHYAHTRTDDEGNPRNIVHRDISPQNILLSMEGHVKICDFGIAKAENRLARTRTGQFKGKLSYMSPEQFNGEFVDARSDVFNLGIVLYEVTLARRLFDAKTDFERMRQIANAEVTPPSDIRPDFPEGLEQIILKALRHDPAERFQTAEEMQRALENWLHDRDCKAGTVQISEYMEQIFPELVGGIPEDMSQVEFPSEGRDGSDRQEGAPGVKQRPGGVGAESSAPDQSTEDFDPGAAGDDATQQVSRESIPTGDEASGAGSGSQAPSANSVGSVTIDPSKQRDRGGGSEGEALPDDPNDLVADDEQDRTRPIHIDRDEIEKAGEEEQSDSTQPTPIRDGGAASDISGDGSGGFGVRPREDSAPYEAGDDPESEPGPRGETREEQAAQENSGAIGDAASQPSERPSPDSQQTSGRRQHSSQQMSGRQDSQQTPGRQDHSSQQMSGRQERDSQQTPGRQDQSSGRPDRRAQGGSDRDTRDATAEATPTTPHGNRGNHPSGPPPNQGGPPSGSSGPPGGSPHGGRSSGSAHRSEAPSGETGDHDAHVEPDSKLQKSWRHSVDALTNAGDALDNSRQKLLAVAGFLVALGGIGIFAYMIIEHSPKMTGPDESDVHISEDASIASEPEVAMAEVTIETEPEGARVVANGLESGTPTPTSVSLVEGETNELYVYKEGYGPVRQTVAGTGGDPSPIELEELSEAASRSDVEINSSPEGATAYLDGRELGETPVTAEEVPAGHIHHVRLELPGNHPTYVLVEVVPGEKAQVSVNLVESKGAEDAYCEVVYDNVPQGSTVTVDDEVQGTTNIAVRHGCKRYLKVEVARSDYESRQHYLYLAEPGKYLLRSRLKAIDRENGKVRLQVPDSLRVFIGNNAYGKGSVDEIELEEGEYTAIFETDDRDRFEERLRVHPNETTTYRVRRNDDGVVLERVAD